MSEPQINIITELKKLGWSNTTVAHHTGKSLPTVARHEKEFESLSKLEIAGYESIYEKAKAGLLK